MKPTDPGLVRVASYNIRKAVGTDRRRDPARILDIIAGMHADVIALQEADLRLGRRRTALPLDQVEPRTGLRALDLAPNEVGIGWHGNAILVAQRAKVRGLTRIDLPGVEPRGAGIADLELDGRPLRVVAVHLGLLRVARRMQISALLKQLANLPPRPTLIAGDFNEWSRHIGLGRLHGRFAVHAPGKSFHAARPVAALDRIALDPALVARAGGVLRTPQTRVASDHLPIWVDVAYRTADPPD